MAGENFYRHMGPFRLSPLIRQKKLKEEKARTELEKKIG